MFLLSTPLTSALTDFAVICGVCFTIGRAIDLYLLKGHKSKLHDWLLAKWLWLEEKKIPDFPAIVARRTIKGFQWVFGKKIFSLRAILLSIMISVCLTTFALIIGARLDIGEWELQWLIDPVSWITLFIYWGVNYIGDFITALITLKLLLVLSNSSSLKRIFLIILDGFLALVCCILVLLTITNLFLIFVFSASIDDLLISIDYFLNFTIEYLAFFRLSPFDEIETEIGGMGFRIGMVIYSSTTFIPTIGYLSFLLFLMLGKSVLNISRGISKAFLLRAVDDEPHKLQVFTLTATLFGLLGGIAKAISHFLG